jgi:hypothetical protein
VCRLDFADDFFETAVGSANAQTDRVNQNRGRGDELRDFPLTALGARFLARLCPILDEMELLKGVFALVAAVVIVWHCVDLT